VYWINCETSVELKLLMMFSCDTANDARWL